MKIDEAFFLDLKERLADDEEALKHAEEIIKRYIEEFGYGGD